MANKEVAHIAALEPAKSNTGFVGTISLSGDTEKSFAVLLADEADSAQRAAIVGAAHEQLRALRPEPTLYERVSSKLRGAFGLCETYRQPKDVTLKSVKQVENALRKGIEAPGDSFTILCRSRACYAELCAAIGITRTDHMVNAELSSLLDNEKPKKNKVVGRAHKLLDAIAKWDQELKPLWKEGDPKDSRIRETYGLFLGRVPEVPKLRVSYEPPFDQLSFDADKPASFRLPFKACLIEQKAELISNATSLFFLAEETGKGEYSARAISYESDNPVVFPTLLRWGEVDGVMHTNIGLESPERSHPDPVDVPFFYLMHALEQINNPRASLVPNEAPKARRPPIGKRKRSPFYDCYDVSLPSGGRVRRLGDAFASGRVVRAHERIRHQRTYKHPRYVNVRGKTVWINATQVGDPKNGVIAKGYDLSSSP